MKKLSKPVSLTKKKIVKPRKKVKELNAEAKTRERRRRLPYGASTWTPLRKRTCVILNVYTVPVLDKVAPWRVQKAFTSKTGLEDRGCFIAFSKIKDYNDYKSKKKTFVDFPVVRATKKEINPADAKLRQASVRRLKKVNAPKV